MNTKTVAPWYDRAQQGNRNRLFQDAQESDSQLRALGTEIANDCGCKTSFGPIKENGGRTVQKVQNDYGGDWHELKDVVRMTIIAPDATRLVLVRWRIKQRCVARHGLALLKNGETTASQDPCGYSGLNFVVRLPNGRPGEIQANVPEILYAKMKPASFIRDLGEGDFLRVNCKYRLEGGLGHALYEAYRLAPASALGVRAAQISRMYYGYFRGQPRLAVREALRAAINEFKEENRQFFPAQDWLTN